VHFRKNVNNNLQQMHFQYIYCISTSTPTCFGPIGPKHVGVLVDVLASQEGLCSMDLEHQSTVLVLSLID
jgi:hypothetical protein